MCGIAGIFRYAQDGIPVDREELQRMQDAMRTRGPDGAGLWISPTLPSALPTGACPSSISARLVLNP